MFDLEFVTIPLVVSELPENFVVKITEITAIVDNITITVSINCYTYIIRIFKVRKGF